MTERPGPGIEVLLRPTDDKVNDISQGTTKTEMPTQEELKGGLKDALKIAIIVAVFQGIANKEMPPTMENLNILASAGDGVLTEALQYRFEVTNRPTKEPPGSLSLRTNL